MTAIRLSFRLLLFIFLFTACGKQQTLQGIFQKSTAHQEYARRLRQAHLDETALGRDWLAAADRALRDSLTVALPFQETGFFRADRATAAAYRYAVRAGEQINIRLTLAPGTEAHVFLDAFELSPDRAAPHPVASADTAALSFSYFAEADRQHLLRVQPALLRTGRYTLSIRRAPSLGFPVRGKNDVAVGSFWGADRDNGARRHEGVDIFARRGTPVVAAASGLITRTGETPRGGKVVWLADAAHGQHLYYAHLDKQLVAPGQLVKMGDTLGLVGNTGNARTTVPHLHFGIYRGGWGAIDPFPSLRRADPEPAAPATKPERLGHWVRVKDKQTSLRHSPTAQAPRAAALARHTPLFVVGSQANWYRVEQPDGQMGYVAAQAVAAEPLRRESLLAAADLYTRPQAGAAALDTLPARSQVAVLGEFGGFRLVRNGAGLVGWLKPAAAPRG
ncbi:SH3 domain-containing protein [Hymenobacter daecheongensis DSM 21074]|uniref:SH3 domain-containing protein n=1 Tax=Hymenobacter daecheongensis DSM 21074 TaxID=1121955 RepID=A0A1M6JPW5_9BACT|nr:M23 family metallopeptidase [Hymenobacter daecheongensis]SHJ48767.1 SH3 domain-containing protein [Hymenobacter daecheongensis DSM 21074]